MSENFENWDGPKSPLKAIRANCLECVNGSPSEVRVCHIKTCACYPFRFGKNPFRVKRILTDEEKQVMAHRLALAREKKLESN